MRDRRAHEPTELTLKVRRAQGGRLVLSVPSCPGWAFPATTPADLARGIEQAYAEATIAAYARLRGCLYDLAETEEVIPPEAYARGSRHPAEPEPPAEVVDEVAEKRRKKHPKTHAPEEWTELSDGYWLSPTGRRYGPGTRQVRAVVASIRPTAAR